MESLLERARKARADAHSGDWRREILPDENDSDYHLKIIRDGKSPAKSNRQSVETIRAEMLKRIQDYVSSNSEKILLMRVPAGVGKTHITSLAVQQAALNGHRVIWASERNNSFNDLQTFAHFDSSLWHNWIPLLGKRSETGQDNCLHRLEQENWVKAGYATGILCQNLCGEKGMSSCPFILQQERRERIVFVRHQHLTVGIKMPDFDLAIVDELPVKVFWDERIIPSSRIRFTTKIDAVARLVGKVDELAKEAVKTKKRFHGVGLVSHLYQELVTVIEDDALEGLLHQPFPHVSASALARHLPYNWLADALEILARELGAYEAVGPRTQDQDWIKVDSDSEHWAERIWIDSKGIHLIVRRKPWPKLPRKMIILDATGDKGIYEAIFDREVEVYAPQVERVGRIYQVVKHTNGKDRLTCVDDEDAIKIVLTELFSEIHLLIKKRGYKRPGIICHKDAEKWVKHFFNKYNTLVHHFGAMRGANALQGCDALFVIGVPGAPPDQVEKVALALFPGRLAPYDRSWIYRHATYHLSADGLKYLQAEHGLDATGAKRLIGVYADTLLQKVAHMFRQAELIHAIHRLRIATREADVFLFTAVALDEEMDAVMQDAPIAPKGIPNPTWIAISSYLNTCYERGASVTLTDLAEHSHRSEQYLKTIQIIKAILSDQPERWQKGSIPQQRGRPKVALIPLK